MIDRSGWRFSITLSVQLSNTEALSAYVFGSKSRLGSRPVARSFDSEVIGETAGRMQSIVKDHQAWLSSNCDRQVSNYRRAPDPLLLIHQQRLACIAIRECPGQEMTVPLLWLLHHSQI